MFDIQWKNPWFFALLLLLPLLVHLLRRPSAVVTFSSLEIVPSATRSLRQRLAIIPILTACAAWIGLVAGLARPRIPIAESRVSRDGIALMMVIDRSGSMNARDLVEDDQRVNRLDVVKDVFADFIIGADGLNGRPDDLVGLVTFAGYADSVCPLTLDHANVANIAKDLSVVNQQSEDGTAIGDGLGLAVERLRRSKAKSRVVILLTDGVNNSGVITPIQAAELATEFGIKVYAIGAGTDGYAPIPVQDAFGRTRVVEMQVEIDEGTLKKIADATGGQYFRAQDAGSLKGVYEEIDQLERTEVAETRFVKHNELFVYPVGFALLMWAVTWGLNSSYFRRLP